MNQNEFDSLESSLRVNWDDEFALFSDSSKITRYYVQLLQNKKDRTDRAWRTAWNKIQVNRGGRLQTQDVMMLDLINDKLRNLNTIQQGINNFWEVVQIKEARGL